MSLTVLPTDLLVQGVLASQILNIPASTVVDAAVNAAAGIQASKLQHQHEHFASDTFATTTAVYRKVIHAVQGTTAALVRFAVGVTTAALGGATVTVDLFKNGSTILSGVITIDNTLTAFALRSGSFTSAACVAGDVFELKIATAATGGGTLPAGFFSHFVIREDAQ